MRCKSLAAIGFLTPLAFARPDFDALGGPHEPRVTPATHPSPRTDSFRRAATLVEVAVGVGCLVLAVGVLIPALGLVGANAARVTSLKNLQVLGEAHACYTADWEGRQFSISPHDLGASDGNCAQYLVTVTCPNQAILGTDENPSEVWGYWLGSTGWCDYSVGGCNNMPIYRPIQFTGQDAGHGQFRLPNLRGFQEYLGDAFYEPVWFSELDELAWEFAKELFDYPAQFTAPRYTLAFSSYATSPASLYDPGVFRRPSLGGFQHPNSGFDDSYDSPADALCAYPDLKSRMVEHSWLVDPPGPANPAWSSPEPYYFNQGIDSKPGVLYFDGSVAEMTMVQAVADDAAMLKSTRGVDGLWSRDTPLGEDGYFGAQSYDDTRNSFHILTTDGIAGRDFLTRKPRREATRGDIP